MWSRALDLKRKAFESAETPEWAFSILFALAKTDLPHAMGTKYANVVTACLKGWGSGPEWKQIDFAKDVTNVLEELTSFGNDCKTC